MQQPKQWLDRQQSLVTQILAAKAAAKAAARPHSAPALAGSPAPAAAAPAAAAPALAGPPPPKKQPPPQPAWPPPKGHPPKPKLPKPPQPALPKDVPWPEPKPPPPAAAPSQPASSSSSQPAAAPAAAAPAFAGSVAATVEEMRELRSHLKTDRASHAIHNTALKWLRDTNENPAGVPRVEAGSLVVGVDITLQDPLQIGVLHRAKGTSYTFVEHQSQEWSWRAMLASFPDDVLEQVVGCGVERIWCMPLAGSYDHKRHHAARLGEGPALMGQAPIWDFVAVQADSTQVRFHPQQTSRKVEVTSITNAPPSRPPRAGLGGSDGPGTYAGFRQASYPRVGGAAAAAKAKAHPRGRPQPPGLPTPPHPPASPAAGAPQQQQQWPGQQWPAQEQPQEPPLQQQQQEGWQWWQDGWWHGDNTGTAQSGSGWWNEGAGQTTRGSDTVGGNWGQQWQ